MDAATTSRPTRIGSSRASSFSSTSLRCVPHRLRSSAQLQCEHRRRRGRWAPWVVLASADYDVVVVGGGISGLCTAQALRSNHVGMVRKLLLTEARGGVGGNITSMDNNEGYLWEEGPNSFQPSDAMLQMAVDAGVADDLVLGDPKAPRFVYWDNELRPTPSGPDVLTFDLLSIWGKLRAGFGAIGIKPQMPENVEETVEQFIRRNLGEEVFERLIEPFCSGVYAGDPAKLGMKAAFGKIHALEENGGSLIGGAIKLFKDRFQNPPPPRNPELPPKPAGQTVGSFRRGLKMLPEAIAKNLQEDIRCGWKLQEIFKSSDGLFTLAYSTPEGDVAVTTSCVALTVPAYIAGHLVRRECPEAFDALINLDYPPVASVTLAYPISAIREDRLDENGNLPGFGQLHPRSQGIVTLGTIYSSSLFPGRAPDGMVLLLNYIGGATNRGILEQSEDQIVEQVDKDIRKMLLKPNAPEPKIIGLRVWPKAIPQFNVGHLEVLDEARVAMDESNWQGVKLGGNYVSGVALGKCVEFSYEFAKEIAEYISECKATRVTAPVKVADEEAIVFT